MRLYYKPLVLLIWLGAVVMAAGGALSLTDRRLRIGSPARSRRLPAPAAPGRMSRCGSCCPRDLRWSCGQRGLAVQPDEVLKDPALETRARDISAGLRCLVCQNQSIDDSDADLARDLRLLVRERLTAGDTRRRRCAISSSQRYGEFVLLRPTFRPAPCCCG